MTVTPCILIVDDEESQRKSLSLILKRKGYEVESAGTGAEALEKARGRTISLALLDIKLPDTDGVNLIAPLKTIEPEIVILMVTGFASVENTVRSLNAGAAGYLVKPINHEEMLGKIQDLLERQDLIRAKRRAEDLLRESEERYRGVVEGQTEFISRFTPDGIHVFVNNAYLQFFGKTREELIGHRFFPSIPKEDADPIRRHFASLIKDHPSATIEHRIIMPDGQIRWQQWSDRAIFNEQGHITEYQSVGRDITERKMMESDIRFLNRDLEQRVIKRTSQLNASLEDKIVLLREVHHRVRNNFQIIISLFNLQSRYIVDENTRQVFRESQNRVRAMSLVHEKLYQSTDIAKIDLDNYIRYLGNNLVQFYGMTGKGIVLNTRIQDINVDINTAIPVGLIINELISNSLKHAFPDGKKGEISLTIQRENTLLTILYKDNGIGIPEDFDWRNAESLGLRLVIILVEQLDGTIELDRSSGTAFTIIVKEK